MVLLSVAIVFALLVTIGLPIGVGFWLNKKWGVPWRIVSYGAMAFFIVQTLVTLILLGINALVMNGTLTLTDRSFLIVQLVLSITLTAILGVAIRWAGMKYLKNETLDELKPTFALAVGYGGAESIILVGIPLLTTFYTMLTNMNIDPATSQLDPAIVAQIQQLWQVPVSVPLAGSVERLSALVMHLTVTLLVLQAFRRRNWIFLAAATGVELVVNGVIVSLTESGLAYGWVILISAAFMVGNFVILLRLNAFEFDEAEKVEVISG